MEISYLEIGNAFSLRPGLERFLYRILEILPWSLSFLTLFLTFFLSIFAPTSVGIFIIFFDLYWFFKAIYFAILQVSAFFKIRKNLKINWQEKLEKEFKNWKEIYHLICLPFYKEGKEIVESSILSLKQSSYPKEKMMVLLAVEERGGEKAKKIAKEMKEKYEKDFYKFFVFFHPKNLPEEVQGKGANVNFAIKNVKRYIEELGFKKENILFSIFDIDTRPYQDYFSIVTFYYLKFNKPKNVAFQPIPVYNNNIWDVPFFSRIVSTSNTFWQMIQQERPEQLVTYSSHTLPFSLFDQIAYPKEVVSDDSRIFWKAFFLFDGDFKTFPLFYPVSMDAVLGRNFISTLINQYRQQRRWAFGVENVPFVIFNFLKNKKISVKTKISQSLIILEGFWSWATASLLIFLMGWLPVILGREKFKISVLGFNLPRLTQKLMFFASFGIMVCAILSLCLSMPKRKTFSQKFLFILQWLFLPLSLIFFGCFPALDAQLKLALGKYLEFWTTEKYRKNEV